MTRDLPALLPMWKEGVLRIFIALKTSITLARFEPATFGSSGKHTNHYTTKATTVGYWDLNYQIMGLPARI
jgi:hypothetical protein